METFHQAPFPELIDQGLVICGDVDCVEQVRRLRDTGADVLTVWMPFGELAFVPPGGRWSCSVAK